MSQVQERVTEYFRLKKAAKDLRGDLKDLTTQHEDYEEAQKIAKRLKELRENIKEDSKIKELREKVTEIKERMELLKEMIRIDLIENSEEEIVEEDRKLKLVYILKELKANDNQK